MEEYIFQYKLFSSLQKQYFTNTPESDSLYRRRNKLVLFGLSLSFYSFTHKWINDYRILFSKRIQRLSITSLKAFYLVICVSSLQIMLKYVYYLNKIYKSYQFGLEGVLKHSIIQKNRKHFLVSQQSENVDDLSKKIYVYNNQFDIIDYTNIKKNQ